MKKYFFLLSSMNVGGVEKAFLGVLSTLSQQGNDIHVGLINRKGGLLDQIPEHVTIHDITVFQKHWHFINDPPIQTIKALLRAGSIWSAFIQLLLYVHFKLTGTRFLFYRYLLCHEPKFPGHFDLAVAFAGPSQMIDFYVCEKVDADKKWGWIHFDISKFGIDQGLTRKLYKKYEKIMVVSKEAKDVFDRFFPEFKDKTEVRYNAVPKESILSLAEEGPSFRDSFEGIRILTVGRISPEKGQRNAILALKDLVTAGHFVKWYFVGEGKDLEFCKHLAEDLGVTDHLCFLGLQIRPYGYMRDCDIYVQPSLHEGYCISLAEALCFSKPIVATAFSGAREQLSGRENAWIAEPTPESLVITLTKALSCIGSNG